MNFKNYIEIGSYYKITETYELNHFCNQKNTLIVTNNSKVRNAVLPFWNEHIVRNGL